MLLHHGSLRRLREQSAPAAASQLSVLLICTHYLRQTHCIPTRETLTGILAQPLLNGKGDIATQHLFAQLKIDRLS